MYEGEIKRLVHVHFINAWRKFKCIRARGGSPIGDDINVEAVFNKNKLKIWQKIVSHASTPSYGSPRAIRDMMKNPYRIPHYTKEDGVQNMTPGQIKDICLEWLTKNYK